MLERGEFRTACGDHEVLKSTVGKGRRRPQKVGTLKIVCCLFPSLPIKTLVNKLIV